MPKLNILPPIVNACGILSYLDVFQLLEKKGAVFGAWIPKSIGPREKQGNKNPTVYDTGQVILNSFALPTQSIEGWQKEFETTKLQKQIIGSAYGSCADDYVKIVEIFDRYVAAWELNVSCPNREPGEDSLMDTIHRRIEDIIIPVRSTTSKPLIAKLSPNEPYQDITRAIMDHVDYIGCGNTIGPGLAIDIYSRRPKLAGVYGGLSGSAIRPINMRMVHEVFKTLKARDSDVEIIAYGGIDHWQNIIEYAIAGASIFGLGTSLINKNTDEIVEFTRRVWYNVTSFLAVKNTSLEKLRGSLIEPDG